MPAANLLCALFGALLLLVAFPGTSRSAEGSQRLEIVTIDGERHSFEVELAITEPDRRRGLMFRENLASDHGMLFAWIGEEESERSFWMRNTLIPLDMIFISKSGVVRSVHSHAMPHDETPIHSSAPVFAVLEVPAGTSNSLGIGVGATVHHPIFSNTLDE